MIASYVTVNSFQSRVRIMMLSTAAHAHGAPLADVTLQTATCVVESEVLPQGEVRIGPHMHIGAGRVLLINTLS